MSIIIIIKVYLTLFLFIYYFFIDRFSLDHGVKKMYRNGEYIFLWIDFDFDFD